MSDAISSQGFAFLTPTGLPGADRLLLAARAIPDVAPCRIAWKSVRNQGLSIAIPYMFDQPTCSQICWAHPLLGATPK